MKTKLNRLLKKNWSGRIARLTILLMLAGLFGLSNQVYAQSWSQSQKIAASDRVSGDLFGCSVGISGSYAIVGARQEAWANWQYFVGAAYIFELDGNGNWQEVQKLEASDRDTSDFFAWSVAISGDYAIVGAVQEDEDASGNNTLSDAGSAYIFERNSNGTWIEKQKIVASDRGSDDNFGYHVSISGNYAIVGAYTEDEDATGNNFLDGAGSAYIFERNGSGVWQEVSKLVASDRGAGDRFGISVSISGNYAIVGADLEDEDARGRRTKTNSGSAYVFERDGSGNWLEVQKIVASDRDATDLFGGSVSVSGDFAIVGAISECEDANGNNTINSTGSAYIFERNNQGKWNQVQKIVASDRDATDRFGESVAISANYAIVSTRSDEDDAQGLNPLNSAGSAYVFEKDGSGNWQQVEKVVPSDREELDRFGCSVAISGDYAIVGAFYEDEDASGNYTLNIAGSAYFFKRSAPDPNLCAQSTLAADAGPDEYTYYGYTPTECASLSGSASGGVGSYSYSWDGVSGQTVNVCPSSTTVYNLTVTDDNGCTAIDNVTVYVTDVRCNGGKVQVCFSGTTECIKQNQVASWLGQGASLGACPPARMAPDESESELRVYPNPTNDMLHVDFHGIEDIESIALFNTSGLMIHNVQTPDSGNLTLDVRSLSVGVYILCVTHTDGTAQYSKVVIYR